MSKRGLSWKLLVCLIVVGVATSLAQVTTGTVLGTVSDATGAVIPGATITLRNAETGVSRTVSTDAAGRYRAPQLGLGSYEITAESAGFQTAVRSGVTMTVGREALVDFTLQVGAVAERITVTGEAPLVETTNATVASLVSEQQMRDLPLNGRSFNDLSAIQPGVISETGITTQGVFTGSAPQRSINGARPEQGGQFLDGVENVSPTNNLVVSSVLGQTLGVDTVREFTVLTSNFGAQYGRAIGGVINAVTRSGTNEFHGSVFEFFRNSALDAKSFFDRSELPIPPLRRNQFGATFGGPIKEDRAFFFLSYEGLRWREGKTLFGATPTLEARKQGILRDKTGKITQTVNVHPDIVPVLNLLPLPDEAKPLGGGVAELIWNTVNPGIEDYGMVRIDQTLSEKDSFFGRWTVDKSGLTAPNALVLPKGDMPQVSEGVYYLAALGYTRIISPALLNTFRAGFLRQRLAEDYEFTREGFDPRLSMMKGSPMGAHSVPGISVPGSGTTPGYDYSHPIDYTDNTFDYSDTVNANLGRHSFTIGGNVKRYQMNALSGAWANGIIIWPSITSFLTNGFKINITAAISTLDPSTQLPDLLRGWRQTYGAFFVQDEFRVMPRLTLNLGLRWEQISSPTEVNGKYAQLVDVLRDSEYKPQTSFDIRDPFRGFSPRIGIAYSLNDNTSIRAGVGVFKEVPLAYSYQLIHYIPPYAGRVVVPNPPFPYPLSGGIFQAGEPLVVAQDYKLPYNIQWNFGIERQLGETFVVKAMYLGTRGIDIPTMYNPDDLIPETRHDRAYVPASAKRPNTNFTAIRLIAPLANSWYNALQLVTEKRLSGGLQLSGSYTWSKNIDQTPSGTKCATTVINTLGIPNVYDIASEKSLSSLDTRHNLILSYTYELPFGSGKPFASSWAGAAQRFVSGWQLNGTSNFRTGLPLNVVMGYRSNRALTQMSPNRPDLRPGADNNPVLGGPDRYFNTSAFVPPPFGTCTTGDCVEKDGSAALGYLGNLGRNTLISPGVVSMNISLTKNTSLGESRNLEFRAEFFNFLNHPNFANPDYVVITSAKGDVSPTAGLIRSIRGTSRQVQLALKLTF